MVTQLIHYSAVLQIIFNLIVLNNGSAPDKVCENLSFSRNANNDIVPTECDSLADSETFKIVLHENELSPISAESKLSVYEFLPQSSGSQCEQLKTNAISRERRMELCLRYFVMFHEPNQIKMGILSSSNVKLMSKMLTNSNNGVWEINCFSLADSAEGVLKIQFSSNLNLNDSFSLSDIQLCYDTPHEIAKLLNSDTDIDEESELASSWNAVEFFVEHNFVIMISVVGTACMMLAFGIFVFIARKLLFESRANAFSYSNL